MQNPLRRIRYKLKTLLALVAFIAVGLAISIHLYGWYTSTPLSSAVTKINHDAYWPQVIPPLLTEEEVIATIENQLSSVTNTKARTIYEEIIKTRRLPRNAKFDFFTLELADDEAYVINLDVMTGPTTGYAVRIREQKYCDLFHEK